LEEYIITTICKVLRKISLTLLQKSHQKGSGGVNMSFWGGR